MSATIRSVAGDAPAVNGVPLASVDDPVTPEELRQRACTELLRQAAMRDGLLAGDDPLPQDGAISPAAAAAIERWLDGQIAIPEPAEEACRRHYEATQARYRTGERAWLRHVLFAVTPGIDVAWLRGRAEACLIEVRAAVGPDEFAKASRNLSNCPSGAQGGDLGWVTRDELAPELAREVFQQAGTGILPRLVHSRFGFHVVEVLEREAGQTRPFEEVREAVALALRQQAWMTAVRQVLQLLAGQARVQGVELDAADSPLVQ